jgi:transposase
MDMIKGGTNQSDFTIKALTHKQLAQMYGVSWSTFRNWMKKVEHEVGKKTGHFYHIHQVKKIFQLFGIPQKVVLTTNDIEDILNPKV